MHTCRDGQTASKKPDHQRVVVNATDEVDDRERPGNGQHQRVGEVDAVRTCEAGHTEPEETDACQHGQPPEKHARFDAVAARPHRGFRHQCGGRPIARDDHSPTGSDVRQDDIISEILRRVFPGVETTLGQAAVRDVAINIVREVGRRQQERQHPHDRDDDHRPRRHRFSYGQLAKAEPRDDEREHSDPAGARREAPEQIRQLPQHRYVVQPHARIRRAT